MTSHFPSQTVINIFTSFDKFIGLLPKEPFSRMRAMRKAGFTSTETDSIEAHLRDKHNSSLKNSALEMLEAKFEGSPQAMLASISGR